MTVVVESDPDFQNLTYPSDLFSLLVAPLRETAFQPLACSITVLLPPDKPDECGTEAFRKTPLNTGCKRARQKLDFRTVFGKRLYNTLAN